MLVEDGFNLNKLKEALEELIGEEIKDTVNYFDHGDRMSIGRVFYFGDYILAVDVEGYTINSTTNFLHVYRSHGHVINRERILKTVKKYCL